MESCALFRRWRADRQWLADAALRLDAPAGLENPPDKNEAGREEDERHAQAYRDIDVGRAVKAPAEAADQIKHRVEQRDGAPDRRQHVDRIKAAAEEGERGDDQERDELEP